jgi:Cdc6-like AAA superfamily ATPase
MNSQILVNPEALSQSYLPEKLLHREKEKAELRNNLKNFINTFMCGPYGSGKTTLVKSLIHELSKKVSIAYIDAQSTRQLIVF